MRKLILIKLGGSLITDKTKLFTQKPAVIKRLAKEIYQARKESGKLLIIGHGGGSYPHVPASKYQTNEGIINQKSCQGIAEVQDAAARLNRLVLTAFLKTGEKAISFNPSSMMVTKNRKITQAFLGSLLKTLELKMLPVVYGDVVFDETIGCCILSTEMILNYLAFKLKAKFEVDKVICAGITNGVYDDKQRLISTLGQLKFKSLKKYINGSGGVDVTGGMAHKVEEALKLAESGVETLILNGQEPGNLRKAILGKKVKGTVIKY